MAPLLLLGRVMLGEYLRNLIEHRTAEVDAISRILMHGDRPAALRDIDQIYMLVGSQLTQAKVISEYIHGKRVVFMGDDDCMSITLAVLSETIGLSTRAAHTTVLDFDERVLQFVEQMRDEHGISSDDFEIVRYNVKDPLPEHLVEKADIFYTNPPYGFSNAGGSARIFLGRCMELCMRHRSRGIAILPHNMEHEKAGLAMMRTQEFLIQHGYVVSESLRGMHQYHLDDRPNLYSGTVILDRIEYKPYEHHGREIPAAEFARFYGSKSVDVPHYISKEPT